MLLVRFELDLLYPSGTRGVSLRPCRRQLYALEGSESVCNQMALAYMTIGRAVMRWCRCDMGL